MRKMHAYSESGSVEVEEDKQFAWLVADSKNDDSEAQEWGAV